MTNTDRTASTVAAPSIANAIADHLASLQAARAAITLYTPNVPATPARTVSPGKRINYPDTHASPVRVAYPNHAHTDWDTAPSMARTARCVGCGRNPKHACHQAPFTHRVVSGTNLPLTTRCVNGAW